MKSRSIIARTATFSLLLLLSASSIAETLTWTGCGISRKAFMAELALAYEKETGVHVELSGGSAAKGIRQVAANNAHMGG